MNVIINPGSGPVAGAAESVAAENMKHFVADCGERALRFVRIPEMDDGDGRWAFLLWEDQRCHEIQMPGLPLDRVRYTGEDSQDIWDYPRLYVDGSSWVWKYAVLKDDDDWRCDFPEE